MQNEEMCKIDYDLMSSGESEAKKPSKILMVVTNTDKFDDVNETKTGVWFEEFVVPYNEFIKNGFEVTVASLAGGDAPIDPNSENLFADLIQHDAKAALDDTKALYTIDYQDYDAIVLPGGHGPMFDLAKSDTLGKIISNFNQNGKLIAAICHGPAGLLTAETDSVPFLSGKKVTSFTNEEERLAKMEDLIPFFLQDALLDKGADFIEDSPNAVNVVRDGNLITAQNYQSVKVFTETILEYLSY